jgi:hypothetical protein
MLANLFFLGDMVSDVALAALADVFLVFIGHASQICDNR